MTDDEDDEAGMAATATATGADISAATGSDLPADLAWIERLGDQARDWYYIGLRLQDEGRLSMASSLLIRASCLEPESDQLREVAARAQFRARQYVGAHATFSGMLALAPKDHFARYASAVCAACLGWHDEALANLTEAVRRRPDVERYVWALDVVQRILNELDGADPVQMPSYAIPPIPLDRRLLTLELGPRPWVPDPRT
jgi:tetratricopeptide (TPR) repeat protein